MIRATVITDASFSDHNGTGYGGWAAWVRIDGVPTALKAYGGLQPGLASSAESEMRAALNGIWLARRHGARDILVRSDCATVGHAIDGTLRKGSLKALWDGALARDDMQGIKLRFNHVKGHNPNINDAATYVNHWVDRHAKEAMKLTRKGRRAPMKMVA